MKSHRGFEFVGRSESKHEHNQQNQHNFLSARLLLQTSNLGFEFASSFLQYLALTVIGKSTKWLCIQSVVTSK